MPRANSVLAERYCQEILTVITALTQELRR